MRKALIVAMAQNRVIGRNNALPWYLPGDLRYFKQATMGKPILMGRKTFESIGRPLPGRLNVVITRDPDWEAPTGVVAEQSLEAAYRRAEAQAELEGGDEIMIIGGGQIYADALPDIDRMYVTQVHADVEGDAWFPEVDWDQWEELGREDFSASENNPYDYSFVVYQRRSAV
ncbi:dihydrofolate reductase [Marinobacter nanhaiticus D15-8W]|uniref:Dihydrofolate reductase n=1 Tax=Marinobacter nanhaiticus D15-8W TaxID=626887 RepID=N6X6U0_9GAMM|nr:dihydrofolate reductase [Marinobacter nanhaiticus]ENO16838.1 dihydrofolate reductase [Marinobacter nanhaiticus D15-8W]BES72654.1 dihydrofolate reductase [Marinobacter nanhaiticus D15-8W]